MFYEKHFDENKLQDYQRDPNRGSFSNKYIAAIWNQCSWVQQQPPGLNVISNPNCLESFVRFVIKSIPRNISQFSAFNSITMVHSVYEVNVIVFGKFWKMNIFSA